MVHVLFYLCLDVVFPCLSSFDMMCLDATVPPMLSSLFCVEQVPIVAVTTAGCGIRALTAMYGSILGLQKLRVLDCVSYISGSSGTTW